MLQTIKQQQLQMQVVCSALCLPEFCYLHSFSTLYKQAILCPQTHLQTYVIFNTQIEKKWLKQQEAKAILTSFAAADFSSAGPSSVKEIINNNINYYETSKELDRWYQRKLQINQSNINKPGGKNGAQ